MRWLWYPFDYAYWRIKYIELPFLRRTYRLLRIAFSDPGWRAAVLRAKTTPERKMIAEILYQRVRSA